MHEKKLIISKLGLIVNCEYQGLIVSYNYVIELINKAVA